MATLEEYAAAAPLCVTHQPRGGGKRAGCLVCHLEKLSAALSRIDYACVEPNEMGLSSYDLHFDEAHVVKHVQELATSTANLVRYSKIALGCLRELQKADHDDGKPWRNPTYLHAMDFLDAAIEKVEKRT